MDTSKLNYSFHDFPGHTHWDYARQWSLVYPGCATSCLAQVLCMVMQWPLSYSWNQDVCLCNHSARNRAEDFGKFSSAVFFASAQRPGEYMRILPPLRVMGNHGCDMLQLIGQWLIAPPFCPGMQTNWMARHDLAGGTCMKLLRKGGTLNLARDVWHGSWIYRTGPYSPKQTKDMLSFFCCPTWLVFFLHKSLFSVAVRLQNATKPFCGYPAMRRRCNSRPITCKSQRCFSHQSS